MMGELNNHFNSFSELPNDNSRTIIKNIIQNEQLSDSHILISAGSCNGQNYLGEISRVKIVGKTSSGVERVISVIIKVPPRKLELRSMMPVNLFYTRELFAYAEMLPTLFKLQEESGLPAEERFKCAKLYKGMSTDTQETLVFDDLVPKGFVMHDRHVPLDLDHIQLAAKTIARLHAMSFVLKAKQPEVFSKLASKVATSIEFGDTMYKVIDSSFEKLIQYLENAPEKDIITKISPKVSYLYESRVDPTRTDPYNVLCHGDCWMGNFLFKYKDNKPHDIRFVDWQIIRLASPVTDLSYLIFLGTDEELRGNHFPQILDGYYRELCLQIGRLGGRAEELYPEAVFRSHVQDIMPFGIISGVMAIPFLLCKQGEAHEITDVLEHFDNGDGDSVLNHSQKAIDRTVGIARDSIRFNFFS